MYEILNTITFLFTEFNFTMTSKTKCVICRTAVDDVLNLGEMKTFENISAHYYCLLLASTIKQSGEDEEGILGFLPSDIKEEIKASQKRICVYCKRKGAAVLCSAKTCKLVFHLPCGIKNDSGHQFHDRFLSHCRTHRKKQKIKRPSDKQICPVCYEIVDFENCSEVLWAPCCKKQSFFHKKCIQQMALSAGYFFKCPMCNNSEVFQKTMKHYGVFIPDRDASWELEPNAFEELLYRHKECNAEVCLCKSGRNYDNLGPWNIVLCHMCGSQGTHKHCSSLKKNEDWICSLCAVEKKSDDAQQAQPNGIGNQPSTSQTEPLQLPQTSSNNGNAEAIVQTAKPKKRKRNRSLRSAATLRDDSKNYSNFIEIDSEDSDVVVIEDEPNPKCLIVQDRSLFKVHNTKKQHYKKEEHIDVENQESSSCADFMNLVITDVRSLSEPKDNYIENKVHTSATKPFNSIDVVSDEYKNIHNKIVYPVTAVTDHQQQPFLVLQEVVYNNNNNNSFYEESSNQCLSNVHSSSSDDIVIID